MNELMIMAQIKLYNLLESIREEERGSSEMVAIVVLIVIVLAMAVIFKKQLTQVANDVMKQVKEFVG